jgi:hypothetical protein
MKIQEYYKSLFKESYRKISDLETSKKTKSNLQYLELEKKRCDKLL